MLSGTANLPGFNSCNIELLNLILAMLGNLVKLIGGILLFACEDFIYCTISEPLFCLLIAPVLQVIYIQSYQTGTLPNDWLTDNIFPVYKKGDKSTPANYRPISLTSVCCKTMEHIICHSILDHLNTYNINPTQHGFRPLRHS